MRTLILTTLCFFVFCAQAQTGHKTYKVGDFNFLISSLALHPNGDTLAVGTQQGNSIYFCNPLTGDVYYEYDVDGYYAGPYISYSRTGKYVLFEQRLFLDYAKNKDQKIDFEVMDVRTGKMILKIEEAYDVSLSPDETHAAAVHKNYVAVYNLKTGNVIHQKDDEGFGNAICYSPNGEELFVSHKLQTQDAKQIPRFARDKKAMKGALKYHHAIYVLDPTTLKKLDAFKESFDQVYDITISANQANIFILSKQHKKVNAAALSRSFVTTASISSRKAARATFYTAIEHPDFKDNGESFIITTKGGMEDYSEDLLQYNLETADVIGQLSRDVRWGEGLVKWDIQSTETKFVILPDGETIIACHGNNLYQEKLLK